MGNSTSHIQRSRKSSSSSFRRQSTEITEITRKIDDKECVFIALQGEIDKAITEHNKQAMKSLAAEIAAHIMDLNQLKKVNALSSSERGRSQRITYSFEIALAKLKSILSSDTAVKNQTSENAQFYNNSVEPDLVNDLIRFDAVDSRRSSYSNNRNTITSLPENEIASNHPSVSRNNSLYSKQLQSTNDVFSSVEGEFNVLKDLLERPIEDINEYYQMDKGIFYLQVQLKNTDVPQGSQSNTRKFELLKELAEFRTLLDQKAGELEEQREITQEVNTLELLVDSATEKELEGLKARARMFQETIEKASWDQHFMEKKIELLRRLARIMERIAYSLSPAVSLRNSVEHLYGNLNSLQAEMNNLREKEELESIESIDRVLEQQPEYFEENNSEEEAIYGNVEMIRHNLNTKVTPRVQRSSSNLSQRGTVYVNADIVRQNRNSALENSNLFSEHAQKQQEFINKRPLPLPRNYDDKIINDLPKHWQRLNEIMDSKNISETDKMEVAEIRRHAEVAKNLFERKYKQFMEKSEESVEL